MSLIDSSYFVGDLDIPNTSRDNVLERLTAFINKHESKLLRDILGYDLWKAFNNGLLVETALGTELIVNGAFTTNASGWLLGTHWGYVGNGVRYNPPAAEQPLYLRQDGTPGTLDPAKRYRLTFSVTDGSGFIGAYVGGKLFTIQRTDAGIVTVDSSPIDSVAGVIAFSPSADFNGLISNVSLKEIISGGPDQKWIDLRDGKEYINLSNRTELWIGFVGTVDTYPKQSMIANYVYCKWMKNQHTQSVGQGEQKAKQINADSASPDEKIVTAWNEMIDGIKSMTSYLDKYRETYPEWSKQDRYHLRKNYWYTNVLGI